MPTWLFFIGITALTMVICIAVTILWLGKNPSDEDDLDRRLAELAAQNVKKRKERDAASAATK